MSTLHVAVDALVENARSIAELVAPAKTAFVVKANAYGHGAVDVARVLEPFASMFCVYDIDEVLRLRAAGIDAPILLLGPLAPSRFDDLVTSNGVVTLWNAGSYFRDFQRTLRRRARISAAHVKVDTGMSRLGVAPGDVPALLATYLSAREIHVAGIYSHLAAADDLGSSFTLEQLARFEGAVDAARPVLDGHRARRPTRHIAASAGAVAWPQTRLDMVRIGIAVYGIWPSADVKRRLSPRLSLRSALSFTASLAQARAGHGLVPIGYANGVPRALAGRGHVVIHGARCPILRVAMNAMTLDLRAAPLATVGTRVTLLGTDGRNSVSAEDWAAWANTVAYEIVARLPVSLSRQLERDRISIAVVRDEVASGM